MRMFDCDSANEELAEIISKLLDRDEHERHEIERLNALVTKIQEERHE